MKERNPASKDRALGGSSRTENRLVRKALTGVRVVMMTGLIAIPAFACNNPSEDTLPELTPKSATVELVTGAGEQEDPYIASARRLIDTFDSIFRSLNGGEPPHLDTQEEVVQRFASDGTLYVLTVHNHGRRNLDIYRDGDQEQLGYAIHPDQVLSQESTVEDTPFGSRRLFPDPTIQPLVVITSSEIDVLSNKLNQAYNK